MSRLLHELPLDVAARDGARVALVDGRRKLTYAELADALTHVSSGLLDAGLTAGDRVAVYLPKSLESVAALFGTAMAGGVFVPVNPLLKSSQVGHILADSGARVLVTSPERLSALLPVLRGLPFLPRVVLTAPLSTPAPDDVGIIDWDEMSSAPTRSGHRRIDADVAAILYTSGSTGRPKGVVLSHANMVAGASSVAQYLDNHPDDRLLAVLPFSFDYGFSQLSTAFLVGARVVLLEYLLPRDVVRKLQSERITGLAGVPPLWGQLAALDWPGDCADTLRYFTNSGGAMPKATLAALRKRAPRARPYLMYGLTEAFRSTYLPPEEADRRPESMGKAIPNVEVLVVDADGRPCAPGEVGELVHRGALVSLGYWNDPEKTAKRFKPLPPTEGRVLPEIAVWSGDSVKMDEDGFLYFVGRRDEMIKTSGYRVSPNEIEEVIYDSGAAEEAVALGVPHDELGQAIVVIVAKPRDPDRAHEILLSACRDQLANFMQPKEVVWMDALPRNPNGKIDRASLARQHADLFGASD